MERSESPILKKLWSTPLPIARSGLRASRIAPRAREAWRAGSDWKLLSSHRHALNFIDSAGRLLSVTQGRIRMGPFSIEVEATPAGLPFEGRTDPFPIAMDAEARVHLAGLTLDLASAGHWDPRPMWPKLAAIPWQSDYLPVLVARLRASAPPESLARVVEHPGSSAIRRPTVSKNTPRLQDLPQSAAAQAATRLVQGLATHDDRQAALAATALAGSGSGLTPSGDDFLMGVMFGAQSALSEADAKALTGMLYRASAGRTNRISHAWLSVAVEGEAIQAWHDLVESILSADVHSVDRACRELIDLGHTSGADALAGFVAFHLAHRNDPTIQA